MPTSSSSNHWFEVGVSLWWWTFTLTLNWTSSQSLVQSYFITGVIFGPGEHTLVWLLAFDLLYPNLHSLWCRSPLFPGAKQLHVCLTAALCLVPSICMVCMACVCISLLLFTFSFVENPENHSETPAAPALPLPALPKPTPKPKPKKTPVPPKGAAAGAGPKGDEVHPIKTITKAPGKQAPVPPPKPASRNATREAGEYALCGVESRVLGAGVG